MGEGQDWLNFEEWLESSRIWFGMVYSRCSRRGERERERVAEIKQAEMGKHPDLLVAHPTSTIFTTIGRNYEIS